MGPGRRALTVALRAGRQALQQQQERSMSRKAQKPKKVTQSAQRLLQWYVCRALRGSMCSHCSARSVY